MSLIDLIISQKLILITVALALLPLFIALLLGAVSRLRASSAKRARRKAKQAAVAAKDAAQVAAIADSRPVSAPTAKVNVPPTGPAPIAPEVASTVTPGQPALVTSLSVASPPAVQTEGQLSSAMQDILSSVFVDEESEARYAVLLQGVDSIAMSDLLALSQRVTKQLRLGIMPTANKEQ